MSPYFNAAYFLTTTYFFIAYSLAVYNNLLNCQLRDYFVTKQISYLSGLLPPIATILSNTISSVIINIDGHEKLL